MGSGFLDYFRDEFSDPMYDPFKEVGSKAWEGADWFFNSPVLKPVSDYLRDEEVKKKARTFIPGFSGLETATGAISGAGALVGMGMDNGPQDNIPGWLDILKRESGEGIHAGIESVAPVDIATAGVSGLSAFKPLKALKPIAEGLNTSEALFGGGQVAHGLGTGNLPEAGMGLLRGAGGFAGRFSGDLERPINLDPRGSVVEGDFSPDLPNFVSAFGERGNQNRLQSVAEHGTSRGAYLDKGRSPKIQEGPGGAFGEGFYTTQITGDAPNYGKPWHEGTSYDLDLNPRVAKGDVSAEKPLFLGDPAPRDLRMQALVELQKARRNGSIDPETADIWKYQILRPETTGQDLLYRAEELVTMGMPMEARASYTGDPYSDFIKSRDYDAWGTNKRGEAQKELVLTDPRRQFKIGEVYDPTKEASREVLADSSGVPIPPIKSLPMEGISQAPDTLADALRVRDSLSVEGVSAPQTGPTSKSTLSPNADTLKTILKSSGLTKFTPKTIVDSFTNAGIPVPPEMVSRIPEILGELESSGWVNKKATGTYTLNSSATRMGLPSSPMGKSLDLESQLKQSLANPSLRVSSPPPIESGAKPIELGQWISETAHDLGYTDLPGGNLTSKMVGDPKGNRTPSSKPVESNDPEIARNKLAKQLEEIRDQIEDKRLREKAAREAKGESAPTQTGPSIRKPPSKRGEVVDPESIGGEGGKPKLYTVTLNDGTSHPVKAKSPEEAVSKAEEILSSKGSKKLVTGVKERISSLERAAESEVNQLEIKEIETLTQAQAREEIKRMKDQGLAEGKTATLAEKERITQLEKISKAQNSEELKLRNEEARASDREGKLREAAHAKELADQIKVENDYKEHLDRLKKREEKLKLKSITDPSPESLGWDILNLPKTLKSSIDISFPLRQGLFLLNRKSGLKAMGKGLKSVKGSNHLATKEDLGNRANAGLYKKIGLNQISYDPTTDIQAQSEQFPSKFAQKIPGVKQSERVYTDQSNLMRADIVDEMVSKWSKEGKTPEKRPELYTGLAKYLNVLTGRDPLPKTLAKAGQILNASFWSPQFVKSRVQILNPKFYWDLPPEVQKMAIRDVAGTIGTLSTVLGVVAAVGKSQGLDVDVESDTRHTDFGKLRVGDHTYDFFSGLLPIIRMASRITTSKQITSKGEYNLKGGLGRPDPRLKDAPFGRSAASEIGGFFEGKTSPAYQIGKGFLSGEDYYGGPYGVDDFLADMALPMGVEDIREGGFAGIPSLLGVGYGNRTTREKSRAADGIKPKDKKTPKKLKFAF